jgi:hypothetical protein
MHTLAGTASTFFIPATTAVLWLLTSKKVFTQSAHGPAVLYVGQGSIGQFVFVA